MSIKNQLPTYYHEGCYMKLEATEGFPVYKGLYLFGKRQRPSSSYMILFAIILFILNEW
jgi:hypothetical protein